MPSCVALAATASRTACSRSGSLMGASVPHFAAATVSASCTRCAATSVSASRGSPWPALSAVGDPAAEQPSRPADATAATARIRRMRVTLFWLVMLGR